MRLVAASQVVPGAQLARDVTPDPRSRAPMLRAGVALTERHRAAVLEAGVAHVWVADALGEGIEPPELLPAELRREGAEALHAVLVDARAALPRRRTLQPALVDRLRGVAARVLAVAQAHEGPAPPLADGAGAAHFALQHALDACVLGTLLGVRAQARGLVPPGRAGVRPSVARLGLGLLLADVGRPVLATNAAGELEEEELDLVRTHPTAGVDLLGGEEDVLVRSVVRGHHERWDGAGYPKAVAARELHAFARLAAVAEVYDAVTSPRPFRAAAPAASGHAAVHAGAGTAFDPEVVALFADVVAPTPVGTTVRLGDGRTGVVAADALAPGGLVVRAPGRGGRVEELAGARLAPLGDTARVGVGAA